ncbi:MAG: tRNA (adenosine(37)-N6)-threonylcarbamoyltransferase complex dimerization subunit type 1 TsaB [Ruthenibacterium sp.]
MTIFALDSAGKTAGVALWQNGALVYESYLASAGTHSETLLSLCDAAFCAAQLCPADIDVFAVCAGPGSFTGLRIGLGIVKGLAFPTDTPCAPVSTLEALACAWPADGLIATALDARRGEVYCALFRRSNGIVTRLSSDGTMSAAVFSQQAAAQREVCTENGQTECVICLGDGAHLLAGEGLSLCPAPYRLGRANGICLAAEQMVQKKQCISAAALSPEYHRLSQAQRERAQKESVLL